MVPLILAREVTKMNDFSQHPDNYSVLKRRRDKRETDREGIEGGEQKEIGEQRQNS
jgi:hypothetical protein